MTDRSLYEYNEEYQRCWRLHSTDGDKPELDYNQLICTIVELYSKIQELEEKLK